jgi:hypothetical protein
MKSFVVATLAAVAAPKPGVDYEALAAYMPQLRAKDGYLDKIIFDGSAGIFLSLVDMREPRASRPTLRWDGGPAWPIS